MTCATLKIALRVPVITHSRLESQLVAKYDTLDYNISNNNVEI